MNKPSFIYATHLNTATASATDTATNYDIANILEGCEDTAWRPADTSGAKTITIALGGILPIGQVAVLGQYLNGVTMEVRGSDDNFISSDVQLSAPTVIGTSEFITAYRRFTEGLYSHIRVIFSGFAASFEIQFIACCRAVSLPYLEDGHDPDVFQAEGSHLVGVAGTYLGATQRNTMRSLSLSFGQITAGQYPPFQLWAEYCVMTMRPFFFVPDIDQPECYFVWVDAKYKFSAPYRNGVRKLAAIPLTGRMA
ncbi:MAG: hypothetical protein PHN84_03345 [Desulfuromonadaceae bacterium]|nr:hypothetical protein [Desulfuromonadaceae bacterium]MDD2854219.1 hypothetical protein [Desulfuromonadaceae bacterium]